jgi:putative ABC transport system ATP-binding protein
MSTTSPAASSPPTSTTAEVLLGEAPPLGVLATLRGAAAAAPRLVEGIWTTLGLALLGTLGLLTAPLVVQRILDVHLLPGTAVDVGAVAWLGGVGLVVALAGAVANQRAVERMLTASAEMVASLRVQVLDRLHALPILGVQAERRGALVSRVTTDLDVVTDFVGWGGIGFAVGTVRVVGALTAVALLDPRLLLVLLPVLVLYAAALAGAQRVLQRAHDRVRGHAAASLGAVSEAVSGLPTIRANGAERHVLGRVDTALRAQFRAEFRVGTLGAVLFSTSELFAAVLTVTAVAAGVLLGGATTGQVVAVVFLVTLLLDPVQTMVETLNEAQSAAAGLRRVLHVLDLPPEEVDAGEGTLPPGALGVSVEGLVFRYPTGPAVLDGLDVVLPAGAHVAVVGATGSGKTTLAKVLVRLLRPAAGRILLGGVPLEQVPTGELRSRVAFVPQEGFLFDATLLENLRYGDARVDESTCLDLAVELGLKDWIGGLPDGLATEVGERGGRLSAGERQLVALLRAAVSGPDLLVLDEATSAVDPRLDVALRTAIERLGRGRTVVTIAHRLATAEAADLVLVLDRGRLVELGTHVELLAAGGTYAALHVDWAVGIAT